MLRSLFPSLCPLSCRHVQRGAHHGVDREALQRVAPAVGGGGVRGGLQAGHGAHRLTLLVQPHILHQVRSWRGALLHKV